MAQLTRPAVGVGVNPPLVYAGALAAGLVIHRARPVGILPSRAARVAGAALIGLSLSTALTAFAALRRAGTSPRPDRPTTALVTSGPYRYTRNPIYLSMAGLFAGVAILANALAPCLLLPLVVLVIDRKMVVREERYLERLFGEEYRSYLARVPRWL
jgi:protein-S-isoprenylcysteine O-methyltransferase Ste14